MNLPFLIARRNLIKHKGGFSSFIIRIAIVATTLSVAVMIIALAVVGGFKSSIREKLYSFEGHIHIHEYGNNTFRAAGKPVEEDGELEEKIAHLPHVKQIAPFIKRAGILQFEGKMEGVELKGVPQNFDFLKGITFTGGEIDYSDTAYSKDIQISQVTADRLDLKAGDMVQLYFLEEGSTTPRIRKVRVSGIFHTGMEEVDKRYALCDIRLLQHINNWGEEGISGYQVNLDNYEYSNEISEEIRNNYIVSPLHSYTMEDTYDWVFTWLNMMDVNAMIILTIMAVVAIINLAVALIILIVEQAKMIGVLKAQGMQMNATRMVFLYYAGLIAGTGIVIGNVVAIGLGQIQNSTGFIRLSETSYSMSTVPFKIVWWHVVAVDVATLLLCVLCMMLPTLYLKRVQPARVLQFK